MPSKPVTVRSVKPRGRSARGQQFVDADLVQNRVDVVDATRRGGQHGQEGNVASGRSPLIWEGGQMAASRALPDRLL